jgi:hypothetical protein
MFIAPRIIGKNIASRRWPTLVSEPGAVATGAWIQRCCSHSIFVFRRLKPALESSGDVIPGIMSLKIPSPLERRHKWLNAEIEVESLIQSLTLPVSDTRTQHSSRRDQRIKSGREAKSFSGSHWL